MMDYFESVEGMDRELAHLARGSGRLRHALGTGLEALARRGGHHDLGFSSVEAYALERCERRARWIQQSRALARRLAPLPALRMALETGAISFSMAQVLAKVARPEDEADWLSAACTRTVRQMQKLVEAERRVQLEARPSGDLQAGDDASGHDTTYATEGSDLRTLTVRVDQEDAWLFECTRMIVSQVAGPTLGDTVEALLGEGTTSLLETLKAKAPGTPGAADFCVLGDEPENTAEDTRQREWEAQRARWRDEAEQRCERKILAATRDAVTANVHLEAGVPCDGAVVSPEIDATAIDAELRRVAGELAVRDLALGQLAERFWKADGWRRLGYATETQYVRERLGASLSWLKGKRALARRVARLPRLGAALRSGAIGYEAASLVASVATEETDEAWVDRARERTVKHLREEVNAAQMLARLGATGASSPPASSPPAAARVAVGATTTEHSRPVALWPPGETTMNELAALESNIVSGAVFRKATPISADQGRRDAGLSVRRGPEDSAAPNEPTCLDQLSTAVAATLDRLEGGDERAHIGGIPESHVAAGQRGAPRPSRTDRARGRVTLRLRVEAGIARYYRWLERLFVRHSAPANGRRASFLRFLCASLVETWKDSLGTAAAYADVYARDRYRCTSPVCTRRDVTPHHLKLRSAGGDDSLENLTSLCVWCHLEGIHGARLRAAPPADHVAWTLGRRRQEHTLVHGRRRVAVASRQAPAP